VTPTVLAGAAKAMKLVTYSAGDFVIQQGETGDKFFLIRSGTVEVLKDTEGQLKSLGTLGSGDFFGELALLRHEPRAATVKALEPLEVFILPKATFDEVVHSSTNFREQLKKEYFA
jgi:CRP-like cAMP-binding protein